MMPSGPAGICIPMLSYLLVLLVRTILALHAVASSVMLTEWFWCAALQQWPGQHV